MGKLMTLARDNAKATMVAFFLITIFFAYFIFPYRWVDGKYRYDVRYGLQLDSSPNRLMIPGTDVLKFYQQVRETFGSDNVSVVYFRDKKIFTPEKMKIIEDVFYKLQGAKGVSKVDSLFNTKNFKSVDGSLQTNALMDPVPDSQEELDNIRKDALRNPTLVNQFIREDGKAIAINVIADADTSNPKFDTELANAIDEVIEPVKKDFEEVFQIGSPSVRRGISQNLISDQYVLIPLAIFILVVLIVICLRTVHGMIIPIVGGGISVIWTMGLMAILGIPIQILTVVIPSIILVIGSAEDMHLIAEYFEERGHGKSNHDAIQEMTKKLGLAVLFTALTTVIGFLSIALNDMPLLKEFGYMSSFGITVSFLVTLIFNPAYLTLFCKKVKHGHGGEGHSEEAKDGIFERFADACLHLIRNYKATMIFGTIGLVGICMNGVRYIKVDNDLLGYFKPNSEVRMRANQISQELSGSQNFFLVLSSKKDDTFKKVENLKKIAEIQKLLTTETKVDKTTSLVDYLSLVHREMNDGNDKFYHLPESDELVSQYLLFFTNSEIERYITSDFKQANIVVRHNISSSHTQHDFLEKFTPLITEILDGTGLKFQFTSENFLINDAAASIADGQAQSLALTLTIIFIMMTILFVNVKAGVLSVIPAIIPIFIFFGVLGYFDIALNPGVAMVADIAIGIAVDNTTHLMIRYHLASKEAKEDLWKAIEMTVRAESRPMFTATLALTMAFLSLCISNFMPIIYFGWLSAMVLIIAMVADLVITPILLSKLTIITLWDVIDVQLRENLLKHSPLFLKMKGSEMKKVVLCGKIRPFKAGDKLINQGEKERSMHILLAGNVDVLHQGNSGVKKLATLSEGQTFGEIALVDEVERTADVVASTDGKLLTLDWATLERVQRFSPRLSAKLFLNISRILGQRLAQKVAA